MLTAYTMLDQVYTIRYIRDPVYLWYSFMLTLDIPRKEKCVFATIEVLK